jgi:FG-GAP repeat
METTMAHGAKRTKLTTLACAAVLAATSVVALTGATPATAATCAGTAPSDFNGDGVSDAAIGVIGAPPFGDSHVHVIYGKTSGLTANASGTALDDQLLSFDDPDGSYGYSLATGDFNGDGCSDLAVADRDAPDGAGHVGAGEVLVYYGSADGLQTSPETLSEVSAGTTSVGDFDGFGASLAAGDFNGDGLADLAVGANDAEPGGAVYVFPGNPVFPLLFGAKRFVEGDGTVRGVDEPGDQFGWSLASGDFNGDGRSDLAIGAQGENNFEGAVFVVRGSASSSLLTATGSQTWTQDSAGISGTAEVNDEFGWSVAAGSFTGDGRADLAVGVPGESVGTATNAGSVNVIYSAGSGGLSSTGNQLWTQSSAGLGGTAQTNAQFGSSVAAGDFNGNGRTDLAVGAPSATIGTVKAAGSVTVIAGSAAALTGSGSSTWTQATAGIAGTPQKNDDFGWSLAALRVRSSLRDDLLVGVIGEHVSGHASAGAVEFVPGSSGGLTATGSQLWSADSAGIKGTSCLGCFFGWSVGRSS